MDGNGRWAKKKGAMRIFGHKNAVQAVKDVTEGCGELGVKYLTLYAFSTENWSRPKAEVDGLMELLVSTLKQEIKTLMDNQVRLITIGDTSTLPAECQKNLEWAIAQTKNNSGLTLILALSYSGRWELARAAKLLAADVEQGKLKASEINEQVLENYLQTSGRSEEHTSELQSRENLVCRLLLENKNKIGNRD